MAPVKVFFDDADGVRREVEADEGTTLMAAAVASGIPGIVAECGGAGACATCHVYVKEEWLAATGEIHALEEDMLEFAVDVRPNSRLSCQIRLFAQLDGLLVTTPSTQA
jgi:ferredoxin, 2Fe-2S